MLLLLSNHRSPVLSNQSISVVLLPSHSFLRVPPLTGPYYLQTVTTVMTFSQERKKIPSGGDSAVRQETLLEKNPSDQFSRTNITSLFLSLVALLPVAWPPPITCLKKDWFDRLLSWALYNTFPRWDGRLEWWSVGWGQSEYPASQNRPKQDLVTTCPLASPVWAADKESPWADA